MSAPKQKFTCPGHSMSHFSLCADIFFRALRHLIRVSFSVLRMIFSTSHSQSWSHTKYLAIRDKKQESYLGSYSPYPPPPLQSQRVIITSTGLSRDTGLLNETNSPSAENIPVATGFLFACKSSKYKLSVQYMQNFSQENVWIRTFTIVISVRLPVLYTMSIIYIYFKVRVRVSPKPKLCNMFISYILSHFTHLFH